tara:strand:- start:36893 stop:37009 length:117 start_codon:yes stop_codon:yes gene_type:complete
VGVNVWDEAAFWSVAAKTWGIFANLETMKAHDIVRLQH